MTARKYIEQYKRDYHWDIYAYTFKLKYGENRFAFRRTIYDIGGYYDFYEHLRIMRRCSFYI